MRKIFLIVMLSITFTIVTKAGETPISGFAGCAPGLWYPERHECVYELAPSAQSIKEQKPSVFDDALVAAILQIKEMIF